MDAGDVAELHARLDDAQRKLDNNEQYRDKVLFQMICQVAKFSLNLYAEHKALIDGIVDEYDPFAFTSRGVPGATNGELGKWMGATSSTREMLDTYLKQ